MNKDEDKTLRVEDQEGVRQTARVNRRDSYSMITWQHEGAVEVCGYEFQAS